MDGSRTGEAGNAAAERHLRLAVAHQADVRRGATHVERDEIPVAGARTGSYGTYDPGGGPRERGADRHFAWPGRPT
jgi:hypothetical protein